MTGAILTLTGAYGLLALLLLALNLRSPWRWPVKAAAIVLAGGFLLASLLALEAMLGWPAETVPPERFRLHAALVREPARDGRDAGAIYLWVSPGDPGAADRAPRAYVLPYSRALHRSVARAQGKLQQGTTVEGRARGRRPASNHDSQAVRVELFEAPTGVLPPKETS